MKQEPAIILFDGVCNLCNGFVQFIIRNDVKGIFRFASLQSVAGQKLLAKYFQEKPVPDSVVLIQNGTCYTKSTAALKITRQLNGLWPAYYLLIFLPAFLRNPVYDWIARNRYRWFGKQNECMVPTPELRQRFL